MDGWEAPLDKKPKSKKGKAHATSEPKATDSNTAAKKPKKERKRPMVGGEEKKPKTSTKPHLKDPNSTIPILHLNARHPQAKKTPKAHAASIKEAEIKGLRW